MEEIRFEEDNFQNMNYNKEITNNKFGMFLIKTGIAKNKKQADIIMLVMSIVFLVATAIIYKVSVFKSKPTPVPYDQLPYSEKIKIPLEDRQMIERNLNNQQ